jgi:galactokinase
VSDLADIEPVATLLRRVRASAELRGEFDAARPARVSRAPGRLDVMGGIADYTGSLVCQATLQNAAAVLLQRRGDRQVHVFSFNLLDENQPHSFHIPVDALAGLNAGALRETLGRRDNRWVGYVLGCLFMLHERGLIDLRDRSVPGLSVAVLSTVPLGAGVASSAALEVATMVNLVHELDPFLRDRVFVTDPLRMAQLCQAVENEIVGAPCGIMDPLASLCGREGSLLRLVCQPHDLLPPLQLPAAVRVIGINSNVRHSVGDGRYGQTRCAAFMGHTIILDEMRQLGSRSGHVLRGDPMRGYLANLDGDDYRALFRPAIPEKITGDAFLSRYGGTVDTVTAPQSGIEYFVRQATDHHVLEARRVRRFVEFLEQAATKAAGTRERGLLLDQAGHLMYASHHSYGNDALLGAAECDMLVEMVRRREPRGGLYGARITGGGCGGTVAVLVDEGPVVDGLIAEILDEYVGRSGRMATLVHPSSDGAWHAGSGLCRV